MAIGGSRFHAVTGVLGLQGTDADGDSWRVTVTSRTPLNRRPLTGAVITLGSTVPGRTYVDGLFGGAE